MVVLPLVAQVGTGKTSLVRQYVHKTFSNNYKSTIGEIRPSLRSSQYTPYRLVRWPCAGGSGRRRCARLARRRPAVFHLPFRP